MRLTIPRRFASFLALCLLTTPAFAATYNVDANSKAAADNNPSSAEKPLKSISAAAKLAQPGDTVLIQGGTYRECLVVPRSGEPGKPITYAATKGQRVILSGADRLSGWKKCTQSDVPGNPKFANIFVTDLDWVPEKIYENAREMTIARTPKEGWWAIKEAFGLTGFSDPEHLTQTDPKAWDGWTVAILEQAGGGIAAVEVASFDPQTHKLTMARPYSKWRKEIDAKRDRFYMQNHLSALSGSGQYVFQRHGQGCRLFAWPGKLDDKGQPVIEAPHLGGQTGIVNFAGKSNLVFDGLEVCFSQGCGFDTNGSAAPNDNLIQNCYVHDNIKYGVLLAGGLRNTLRHCNIRRNSNGLVAYECTDMRIEENDIGPNFIDGIDIANHARNSHISRNFLHDNNRWGHPDNLQFWGECEGTVIENNVFLNGGQGIMSEEMIDSHVINNLFVGSDAVLLIAGGDTWEIRNNTVVACAASPTNFGGTSNKPGHKDFAGKGFKVFGNIIAPLHAVPLFTMNPESTSDYDLLWNGGVPTTPLVITPKWKASAVSIGEIRSKFNSEQHGLSADPKFVSVPGFFTCSDYSRTALCTASKLLIHDPFGNNIVAGDTVEIDFDGVPREVTEVGKDFIAFKPAMASPPDSILTIANWGKQKTIKWDLRLRDNSPAKKANEGGKDIGCNLILENYVKGDFNGDGQRDLPEVPKD